MGLEQGGDLSVSDGVDPERKCMIGLWLGVVGGDEWDVLSITH